MLSIKLQNFFINGDVIIFFISKPSTFQAYSHIFSLLPTKIYRIRLFPEGKNTHKRLHTENPSMLPIKQDGKYNRRPLRFPLTLRSVPTVPATMLFERCAHR